MSNRYIAWKTPCGMVDALFLIDSNGSDSEFLDEDTAETRDKVVAARVAIAPTGIRRTAFRAVFDFIPHDPLAKITYQRTLPKNSEIFGIAIAGQVAKLIEALNMRTACLTDRDEEGRSLLNLSCQEASFRTKTNPSIVCMHF
jgi:hypothetical protein